MRTHTALPLLAVSALLLAGCTNVANQATQETTPSESPSYYTSTPRADHPSPRGPDGSNLPGHLKRAGAGLLERERGKPQPDLH